MPFERAMEHFPLSWRWTDPNHTLLSQAEQDRIRPLSESEANELWTLSLTFADAHMVPLPSIFNEPAVLRGAHEANRVEDWLASHLPTSEPIQINVSWDRSLAVRTDTALFVEFWDSFCYPASDDVSIWPADRAWVILYFHEDDFYFATRRLSG